MLCGGFGWVVNRSSIKLLFQMNVVESRASQSWDGSLVQMER